MRSWTDRFVLAGLAVIGTGLLGVGSGKALARFTISGAPMLVEAPDAGRFEDGGSEFTQLADAAARSYPGDTPAIDWPGSN